MQHKTRKRKYPWLKDLSDLDKYYIKRWAMKMYGIKKLGNKCKECGNDNIYVLDFHHIDEKNYSMIQLIRNNSIDVFIKELQNCTLLCSNCHRLHHRDDPRFDMYQYLITETADKL